MMTIFNRTLVGFILLSAVAVSAGELYAPPATARVDLLLDSGWRFQRQEVAGGQKYGLDDSAWSPVSLPHTWNDRDGEDGGNNYYRGTGWYRKHYSVDSRYAGRHFFLKFDGAFDVADVWLNGNHLGQHQGGFAAFVFDVTPYLRVGKDNVIAVKVSNAYNVNLPPISADFTFFGGLYRDVHLLATDPVQISPLDYGSAGVYLKPFPVSSDSANLQVTTVVSNANLLPVTVKVRTVIADGATNVVMALTNVVTLPAGSISNVVARTVIDHPRLWDGLADPYLYQAFVEVWEGGKPVDVVAQPLGFRYYSVDPTNGFFLNGHYLDLHGVCMHQDWIDRGWAIGEGERRSNFALLKEIGATALRLSHYEHAEQTYQLADQSGIVLWSEIPVINNITESPAFYTNALRQMRELIRQRYNHPAVVCWGLFNEITLKHGPATTNLVRQLARLEAEEDPTRPSTSAANAGDYEPSNWYSDLMAFNKYFGWYNGARADFGGWADKVHAEFPNRRIGISEFGAGANIAQHSEDPVAQPSPGGRFHPEEYQNLYHETYWLQMKARPFLWCKFIWNLCDFASDARKEGDAPGRNDKGLVTYDRQVRKDAFYWYKANWTTNPMVYITGHTFTNRMTNVITARVYANCDSVELFLNGASQGSRVNPDHIFTWPLTLRAETNEVQAVGTAGGVQVRDSLVWVAPAPPAVSAPTAASSAAAGDSLTISGR
jgi:beta-galactosidase